MASILRRCGDDTGDEMLGTWIRYQVRRLIRDERGATAIEYALIAGFISIVIVASAFAIGQWLQNPFDDAAQGLGG